MNRSREVSRVVVADSRDAQKLAKAFFAQMPWDGERALDPAEWPAARFLELVCGANGPTSATRSSG